MADLRPGDMLHLNEPIGDIPEGSWVVWELDWMVTLSRLGANEDGDLCTTARVVKVTWAEMERFTSMELNLFDLSGPDD